MSSPQAVKPAAPAATLPYSPDYWDLVLEQLYRRPAVWISLGILVLFYALAVYAPLLANDRPLLFEGNDHAAYRRALRELPLVAGGVRAALASTARSGADPGSLAVRLEREFAAVELRAEALARQIGPGGHPLLDDALAELTRLSATGTTLTAADLDPLEVLCERIKTELNPAAPGAQPVPGVSVGLVPYTEYPAIRTLSRGEIFFMVLGLFLLPFPILNRAVNRWLLGDSRARIRRARGRKAVAVIAIAALAALAWPGEPDPFFVSNYKPGMTKGDVIASRVWFTPLPYGLAETHPSEGFRPPTWNDESAISETGYYVSGPRAGQFELATGLPRLPQRVEVRIAELPRNHPLRHPLGTDSLGRDVLARLIWGARVSLAVGIVSTLITVVIGTLVGAIAGFFRGRVDSILSRIIEVVQCFPVFFLILIVVAFVGPSILNIMLAIGLVRWTAIARLVRGEFIRLGSQDFVVAGQALGASSARLIFRHILPNALGPLLVAATFGVASGILTESALSFLGFGIQLPIPSWGSLLTESRQAEHWWIQIFPGSLIFITVMLYNLLGEGVRDALDPRTKLL